MQTTRYIEGEKTMNEYETKLGAMTDEELALEWGRVFHLDHHPWGSSPNSKYVSIRAEAGRRIDPTNVEWKHGGQIYSEEQGGWYGPASFVRTPGSSLWVLFPEDLPKATAEALSHTH
jgi:hypothetical protein